MGKEGIMKKYGFVIILLIIVGFIAEMAAPGLLRGKWEIDNKANGQQMTGLTVFNGTIRTYEPVLFVQGNINQSIMDILQNDTRISTITKDQQGWLINVTIRDDVYELAADIKKSYNLTSNSVANIILPPQIVVYLQNGSIVNTSTSTYISYFGPLKLWTEPMVEADSVVLVRMQATVQGDSLIGSANPTILAPRINLTTNATITKLITREIIYSIPFEDRNAINVTLLEETYGNENVSYLKNSFIEFNESLTVTQIMQKSNLSYITHIGQDSANIKDNYNDSESIKNDFTGLSVTFPYSILKISSEKVSISMISKYKSNTLYKYYISVPKEEQGYSLPQDEQKYYVITNRTALLNSTVNVTIDGITIGNSFVRIDSVKTN